MDTPPPASLPSPSAGSAAQPERQLFADAAPQVGEGSAPRHVFLIDGSGYIFRAFHALPPMNRSDGTPVNAVLGYCNMLLKTIDETDADHIAVVFDAAEVTFRNRLYDQYKAQRPPAPPELVPQFPLVREATEAFNVAQVEMADYEADDLIATYARLAVEAGATVTIVSSDKDLMQLVRPGVTMFDPIKQKSIGPAEVFEKFGVGPDKVVEVQALCGDSVDNVPGVPGIGVKTAAELINLYGDVETLLARAAEIKQPKRRESLITYADQARVSRALVLLKDDVAVPCPLAHFRLRPTDHEKLTSYLKHNQFRTLLNRVETRRPRTEGVAVPGPAPAAELKLPEAPAPLSKNYVLVQDVAALDAWIARATAAGVVGFDTETNSLDAVAADLVGVSLAVGPGEACYVPLGHIGAASGQLDLAGGGEAPPQIPLADALARLKGLLEDPSVLKVGHNIKYDLQVMASHGISVGPTDCTMLMEFSLHAGLHGMGLDELALIHLGHEMIKFKDVTAGAKGPRNFAAVGLEAARDYAAEDADVCLRLWVKQKPELIEHHRVAFYETIERPMPAVVAEMERHGIKVDRVELDRLSADFGRRMGLLEIEIHALAGGSFNIGSPKQLGEVLFDRLGLPGGKKGKTGAYGTEAALLEQLAYQHELPRKVLDWRQLSKLKSTYADALVGQINPKTGRVHTSYSLTGAATGRLASTDPNLQNIPIRTEEGRKIRRAFIAEPGHVLLSADYSQIELRLAAEVADIPALKEAFRTGLDIHAMTASEVFGVPVDGMDPSIRRRAKAINFGIIYGISAFGLANQLSIPQGEAADYIRAYFAKFPGIRDYMDRTKALAREQGYVTTIFGRRCYTPGIRDSNPARRAFSERAAINAPLQGAAADIIKRAMIRLPGRLKGEGLKTRMLLQVHDELVFEAPEDEADRAAPIIRHVMENSCAPALELSVPLVVETGTAKSWDEAH